MVALAELGDDAEERAVLLTIEDGVLVVRRFPSGRELGAFSLSQAAVSPAAQLDQLVAAAIGKMAK